MKEAVLSIAALVMLLAFAVIAEAQQQAKIPKIGWLAVQPASAQSVIERFKREFRKLGYIEGKNVIFEHRHAEGKIDHLPALAEELVRLKVDVLIAPNTPAALALKNATRTIPIVFIDVTDPIGSGLVDSLARPGGNITGFTLIQSVLAGKRLELLKETIPNLTRVAIVRNPQQQSSVFGWKESQLPARELGLQLYSMEVSGDKFESELKNAIREGVGALSWASSPSEISENRMVDVLTKYRMPSMHTRREVVERGALISYGADRSESFTRTAVFVDKILKGTPPAQIPVEQPMRYELTLNLKTAKLLDLTFPPIVLMRATKVIK